MIRKVIILIYIFTTTIALAQEKKQTLFYDKEPVTKVLKDIEKRYDVKFSYPSDLIGKDETISLEKKEYSLADVLFDITYLIDIKFLAIDKVQYYLSKIKTHRISEVIVQNYLTTGISKNKDATFKLKPNKIGLLAGLTENDVLESIQQLPGVVSINETATEFTVRGGNSDQNNIIWDNINIYHGGHLFGMVSVFNPNIAKNITFYNKGTNAKYGERISSVIAINTNKKIVSKTQAEFGINGISSDAFLEIPLIKNKLSLQTSFRRSYEDLIETKTFKKYEDKAFQNTKILEEKFHFKDFNIKLNYKPNSKNSVYFSLIHIDNDLLNDYKDIATNTSYKDFLDSENDGYSLEWQKKWTPKISLNTTLSHSYYTLFYNYKVTKNNILFSNFYKTNAIQDTKLTSTLTIKSTKNTSIDIGYQNTIKKVAFLFKEEQNISYVLDQDNSKIATHALFANYKTNQNNNTTLYTGLRLNYYSILNKFRVEPRIVLTQNLSDYFKLQLTGEIKNQIITQIDETVLSELSLEKKIWRLADGDNYPIINSYQLSSSLLFAKNNWSSDIDIYYKKTTGITALALGFLNPLDNTFHIGEQKVVGLDFYLKRDFNALKTWISYSFINVQNRYNNLNNNLYFRANNDIKHALTIALNYNYKKIDVALGWKYRTGRPLTDLDYDINGNAFFHGINTEQLADYHRLDLSITYKFIFSKKRNIKSKIGFSIRNLYNKKNHLSTEFIGNNSLNDPIQTIQNYSIENTPNFLFRLYF